MQLHVQNQIAHSRAQRKCPTSSGSVL